ncbi:MAG: isoprenylcysteine carboxylmethyltransferase family protein [Candidatus Brocadiia bacterium]
MIMKLKARAWVRRIILLLVLLFGHVTVLSLGIGIGLIFLGMFWHFWAIGALVRNKQLTKWGPYRFVRHPFYLGNLIIDLGLCAAGANYIIFIVYAVLFFFAYYLRMKKEEAYLTGLFPNEYPEYMGKVPRFIPLWFKRFPDTPGNGFQWSRIISSGNELARISRLLLHPMILYIQLKRFSFGAWNVIVNSVETSRYADDFVPGLIGMDEIIIIGLLVIISVFVFLVHRRDSESAQPA